MFLEGEGETHRNFWLVFKTLTGRRGGLMVSALAESGSSGPGSSAGRGHCASLYQNAEGVRGERWGEGVIYDGLAFHPGELAPAVVAHYRLVKTFKQP